MRRYSHTALKRWQRCNKKWEYYYIDRIEPEERPAHFARGSLLHDLLEKYHTLDPAFGDAYLEASPEDRDIMDRYDTKWAAEPWEVLHAEEEFEIQINGYTVVYKPDLVVKIGDDVWVVDHKTTKNIPDEWDPYNMTDFQHLLYVAGMQEHYPNVRGFIFNYVRTKAPTKPALVKDGSRIANLRAMDTDCNTLYDYAERVNMLGDPDVQDKLVILKHAPDRYFQRHFLPVTQAAIDQCVADTGAVLDDMASAEDNGGPYPRHVLSGFAGSAACGRCEYQAICHADFMGINTTDITLLGYKEREKREDQNG